MSGEDERKRSSQPMDTTIVRGMLNLKNVPLFSGLSAEQLLPVARVIKWMNFHRGDVIMSEGEEGRWFYQLLDGTVSTSRRGRPAGRLEPGDCFGETELFDQEEVITTVVASSEVIVLRISKEDLQGLIELHPFLAGNLIQLFVKQIREEGARWRR